MSDKLTITEEMVDSFAGMIKSPNAKDVKFAVDVLEGRDKTDLESEENFQSLSKLIIDDKQLFPTSSRYIVTINGKMLVLKNDRAIFYSKSAAERALASHLTSYLGKSKKNVTLSYYEKKQLDQKAKKEFRQYDYKTSSYIKVANKDYDPNFNAKAYRDAIKEKKSEDIGSRGKWYGDSEGYYKAMKMVFGGGKELRDFLINNGIAQIVQI